MSCSSRRVFERLDDDGSTRLFSASDEIWLMASCAPEIHTTAVEEGEPAKRSNGGWSRTDVSQTNRSILHADARRVTRERVATTTKIPSYRFLSHKQSQ
jgi:hypothetical protein